MSTSDGSVYSRDGFLVGECNHCPFSADRDEKRPATLALLEHVQKVHDRVPFIEIHPGKGR